MSPGSDRPEDAHGTPRWVKWLGAFVLLLILLLVGLGLLGRGHGPRRHVSSDGHRDIAAATGAPRSLPG